MRGMQLLRSLWVLTLVSAFLGTLLSFGNMPNLFAYRIFFAAHLVLFGGAMIYRLCRRERIEGNFYVRPYLIFLAFWLAWALISLLWAPSKWYGVRYFCFLLSGCSLIFFTVYYFQKVEDLKLLMGANLLVLLFEIGLGLWEVESGFHLYGGFPDYYLRHNEWPVLGTFGHPNNFATYLSMYLPLLYVWGKGQKSWVLKLLCPVVLLLGFHLIVASMSRANMLAAGLGLLTAGILRIISCRPRPGRMIPVGLALVLLTTALVIFSPQVNRVFHQEYDQLSRQAGSVFTDWGVDGSIGVRKILITRGLEMVQASYGLGVGPGNGEFLMQKYREETFGNVKLHNWWVEVLVDYGVVVWVLYLVFFLRLFRDLFQVYRTAGHGKLKMWSEGLLISLSAFSLGVISNGSMTASPHMWILYGLAVAVVNIHRSQLSGRGVK